jgi:SpoVK/Ycf46/Vps4 family AAA+-type ATPase
MKENESIGQYLTDTPIYYRSSKGMASLAWGRREAWRPFHNKEELMRKMIRSEYKMSARKPYVNDLEYLQDELEWVECRCRRILANRRFENGPDDPDNESDCRVYLEPLRPPQKLPAGRIGDLVKREERARTRIDRRRRVSKDFVPSLDKLCKVRTLDQFERTVLILAAATSFSHRFKDLFGALSREDEPQSLTVEVVFEFMELPLAERVRRRPSFSPRSALVRDDLLTVGSCGRLESAENLLSAEIEMPPRTFNYLVGERGLSEEYQEFSSFEQPRATFDQVVIEAEDRHRILAVVDKHEQYLECRKAWGFDDVIRYGRGVVMLFHGKPGTGKTMTAHAIAHRLGKRILNVDIPTFLESCEVDRFLPGLFREARLHDALLFFDECEALFASRRQGHALMTMLLTEIERFEGIAIMATNLPEFLDEALDRRILVKVRFPEPDRGARLEIWRKHIPAAAPLAADVDLEILADRYDMAGGYIKNAILLAVADAVHSDGKNPVIRMEHLERAARSQLHRPVDQESDLVVPKAQLSDVILPAEVLREIEELVAAARNRRTVLERWGIGRHLTRGKGVSALFHGKPGTGKTLAAEAVAAELGRPLRIASVPSLVSKWVGETEKNLTALFRQARLTDAVLLLDEADSLLTARGEGHASRHDDAAVNVLLQLVEDHDGVVLLATNLADRLDPALARRLTYALRFPLPEANARADIWRRHVPSTVPTDGPIDFDALGAAHALSGGQIRNAVFKAAFRAARGNGRLSTAWLEQAAAEESESVNGVAGNRRAIGFTGPATPA